MISDSRKANDNGYEKRGFTLLEILIAISLLSVLLGVSAYLFAVSMRAWSIGQVHTEVREDISYAIEKTVRDLKEMSMDSLCQYDLGSGSIAHTIQYDDLTGNRYVLYLYNASDGTLDSTYSESFYDLRKANINGGDVPSSGDGALILRDLVSPDAAAPATALTINTNQITLDFVVQRSDETARLRTKVRPRNL
jgi:prepilin-type N-terminal cleavage/methylation domain-containing protein